MNVAFLFGRQLHISRAETEAQVAVGLLRTPEGMTLKADFSRLAKHLFWYDGVRMIII